MKIYLATVFCLIVVLGGSLAYADPILTGITVGVSTSSGGSAGSGNDTNGLDGQWNVYVATGAISATPTFINCCNNASTAIDISLTPGLQTYSIYFYGNFAAYTQTDFFFDNAITSAGIGAYSQEETSAGPEPAFFATPATSTNINMNGAVGDVSPGSLSTVLDGYTITLSDYLTESPSYFANDLVSPESISPVGSDATSVTQFTLDVEQEVVTTPEPSSMILLCSGLGAALARLRKKVR